MEGSGSMIWRCKQNEFQDYNSYWRKWFCLWPRRVDGYVVWLSVIEANRRYYVHDGWFGGIKRGYWKRPDAYRLTERQRARLGLKW